MGVARVTLLMAGEQRDHVPHATGLQVLHEEPAGQIVVQPGRCARLVTRPRVSTQRNALAIGMCSRTTMCSAMANTRVQSAACSSTRASDGTRMSLLTAARARVCVFWFAAAAVEHAHLQPDRAHQDEVAA